MNTNCDSTNQDNETSYAHNQHGSAHTNSALHFAFQSTFQASSSERRFNIQKATSAATSQLSSSQAYHQQPHILFKTHIKEQK